MFYAFIVLCVAVALRPAMACHPVVSPPSDPATNCGPIGLTAVGGVAQPMVLYTEGTTASTTFPITTKAVVYCNNAGQLLTASNVATDDAYTNSQVFTCQSNGQWGANGGTTNQYTCVTACQPLNTNPATTTVTRSTGAFTTPTNQFAPFSTVSVACTTTVPDPTMGSLFEGTSTSALTSPQTYICNNNGMWSRSGGSAVTQVTCQRACGSPSVSFNTLSNAGNINNFKTPLLGDHGTTVASGTEKAFELVFGTDGDNSETVPCPGKASNDVAFYFTDGTNQQADIAGGATQSMTCVDGAWFVKSVAGTTVNKYLTVIECLGDFA